MKYSEETELKQILNIPTSPAEIFLRESENKEKKRGRLPMLKQRPAVCKAYARFPEIKLPSTYSPEDSDLLQTLRKRRSRRSPAKKSLSLDTISFILYYSVGISLEKDSFRTYPSGGALFPCEIYLISQSTSLSKKPFLFHYYPLNHSLEKLWRVTKKDLKSGIIQKEALDFPMLLLITGLFKRSSIKYGLRGYRYTLIEAGHIGQNIALIATYLGLNHFPVGGFVENKINKILEIDGLNESILYIFPIG